MTPLDPDKVFASLTLTCDLCGKENNKSDFNTDVWKLFREAGWFIDLSINSSKPYGDVHCPDCHKQSH